MDIIVWAFLAVVGFSDGTDTIWPSSWETQEACEEFRSHLPQWFTENAESLGIVTASWGEECKPYHLHWEVDPLPLDPHSDGHSH